MKAGRLSAYQLGSRHTIRSTFYSFSFRRQHRAVIITPTSPQSVRSERSSDSPDIKPRLRAVAKKIIGARREVKTADVSEVLFNKRYDLEEEILKFERGRISEALAKVNGKVIHAAKLLGLNYQKLAYIIETRHRTY